MESNKSVGGFCRACFSDTKLFVASEGVAKAYRKFVAQPDPAEPLCFCTYCGYLFQKVVIFLQQCSDANKLLESFDNQKEMNLEVCYNLETVNIQPINIYPSGSVLNDNGIFKIEEESEDDSKSESPDNDRISESSDNDTLDRAEVLSDDSSSQDVPIAHYLSQDAPEDERPIRNGFDIPGNVKTKESNRNDPFLNLKNEVLNKQNMVSKKSKRPVVDETTAESDDDCMLNKLIHDDEHPLQKNLTSSHKASTEGVEKYRRSRDYCVFCEKKVLNFARHLIRQHRRTPEVRKILSYPIKTKERKDRITSLRKKGNYVINRIECQRPMRKVCTDPTYYLPCVNCLGFYSRKHLWKHNKKCVPSGSGSKVQVAAQNFMCDTATVDPLLQKYVFSRMRTDRISFVAKKDSLICRFGVHYMKIRRIKSNNTVHVVSRKMRELSKLLIEIQNIRPEIKTLFEVLKPQNYGLVVMATKVISKYDATKDSYMTPTYPMNISASLKNCCYLVITRITKSVSTESSEKLLEDLNEFLNLMRDNWRLDFSSDTNGTTSNTHTNNVTTMISLATDLKRLNQYLSSKAKKAALQLAQEGSGRIKSYTELVKTVFSRVLLLNRIPPGELHTLIVRDYENGDVFKSDINDFDKIFTATEKILFRHYRCVSRGKGFPILFSPDIEQDIETLISVRPKYIDDSELNLFAIPSVKTHVNGYNVLYKFSIECGVGNPNVVVSPKLRKHTAILTQLFGMSENLYNEFSKFMLDTNEICLNSYKPSEDIVRTGKILKVLMSLKNGDVDLLRGNSLDGMDLDMEEEIEGETMSIDDIIEYAAVVNYEEPRDAIEVAAVSARSMEEKLSATKESENNNCIHRSMKRRILTPWTLEQKEIVLNHFQKHIELRKAPKRHEIDVLKVQHPDLFRNKDWLKIKVFIQNAYMKRPH